MFGFGVEILLIMGEDPTVTAQNMTMAFNYGTQLYTDETKASSFICAVLPSWKPTNSDPATYREEAKTCNKKLEQTLSNPSNWMNVFYHEAGRLLNSGIDLNDKGGVHLNDILFHMCSCIKTFMPLIYCLITSFCNIQIEPMVWCL